MLMCSDLSVNVFLIHVTVAFLPNALSAVLSLLSQGMELNTTAKTIIQVSVFSACSSAWTFICPSHSSGVLLIFCFANVVLHNLDNFSCYVFISKSFWCFSCTSTLEQMHVWASLSQLCTNVSGHCNISVWILISHFVHVGSLCSQSFYFRWGLLREKGFCWARCHKILICVFVFLSRSLVLLKVSKQRNGAPSFTAKTR